MKEERIYIAIDLKSFYASVECVERGFNPLTTNLVVADESRTEKTICLAVSPSLKAYGIPGRARLFEVVERVKEVNLAREKKAPGGEFTQESFLAEELDAHPEYKLSYIAAPPRMAHYMKYSSEIYQIYLRYIAPEDIVVYSVDEVFIDATDYLNTYQMDAHALAMKLVREVYEETGITATAGIGTNLYLAKIAMDIRAKHMPADENGVRIAELDEVSYREHLWGHRPITDFWRIGRGYAKRLASMGIYTMGDVARLSLENEEVLYKAFGINAELLIDHAWGYEPVTMDLIRKYRPSSNSFSNGQVLSSPYTFEKARIVAMEMADVSSLHLVEKGLVTDQVVLTVGYDVECLNDPERAKAYKGDVSIDYYGRRVPKHAHGTENLSRYTASTRMIVDAVTKLFDRHVDPALLIRRINIAVCRVIPERDIPKKEKYEQLDLFTDYGAIELEEKREEEELEREKKMQKAILDIKKKYGKNAILRGTNFLEGATMQDRNRQIGGHKA